MCGVEKDWVWLKSAPHVSVLGSWVVEVENVHFWQKNVANYYWECLILGISLFIRATSDSYTEWLSLKHCELLMCVRSCFRVSALSFARRALSSSGLSLLSLSLASRSSFLACFFVSHSYSLSFNRASFSSSVCARGGRGCFGFSCGTLLSIDLPMFWQTQL